MGLNIRRRAKKRLPARVKQRLFQPEVPDEVWSLDYLYRAACGMAAPFAYST